MGKTKNLFMEDQERAAEEYLPQIPLHHKEGNEPKEGELPYSKVGDNFTAISNMIEQLTDVEHRVKEDDDYALDTLVALKTLEKVVKNIKDSVEEYALDEFDMYGEKTVKKRGHTIIKQEGRGRYNYSKYEGYMDKKKSLKEVEEKMKAAYKTNSTIVDEDTGEVIPPAEFNPGKTVLAVKEVKE